MVSKFLCTSLIIKQIQILVFLRKGILKICSKFTVALNKAKLLCNFIEITLRYRCSPVNLLHIFRTPFYKKTSGGLFLAVVCLIFSFDPDPRAYHTVWGCVIGITFSLLVTWTVSQPTAQRALAARTLRDAKM